MATKKDRVDQAAKLYEDFTGGKADSYERVELPKVDVAISIGDIEAIAYNTVRDGKPQRYLHKFEKGARPRFAVSHDGKTILMFGGNFTFTERGITDYE